MFDFETLHPNKKLAYLDGLVCGLLIAHAVRWFRKISQEDSKWKKLAEADQNNVPA